MEYPSFVAIDASSYEDSAHPVAIAWSLADGTVKTTLIQPDDDWDDWDFALEDLHGISQDTLYQMGETGWSVIRELEADLDQPLSHPLRSAPARQSLASTCSESGTKTPTSGISHAMSVYVYCCSNGTNQKIINDH